MLYSPREAISQYLYNEETKMKKILLSLLVLLSLLSFVSCEKDKSEEVISNYENFTETFMMVNPVAGIFPTETNTALKDTEIDNDSLTAFLSAIHSGKKVTLSSNDNTKTKFDGGYIKIEGKDEKKKTSEISNASFTVSYKVDDTKVENKTYKISSTATLNESDDKVSFTYSLTINDKTSSTMNDKTYKSISYTYDGEKFTSAKVDGKDVSLRLLNASRLSQYLPTNDTGSGDTDSSSTTEGETNS